MKRFLVAAFAALAIATSASAEVRTKVVEGGQYGEARTDGAYASLVFGSHIDTHLGRVELPRLNGLSDNVLFLRTTPVGEFKMCGQSHTGAGTWEWAHGEWHRAGDSFGVNPCIYDWNGQLHIGGPQFGTQGFRWVNFDNSIVLGDLTYADPARKIWEYTTYGDITIGQGEAGCIAIRGAERRMLEPGHCTFVRFTPAGEQLAVSMVKLLERKTVFLRFNAGDLSTFPVETPVIDPPPPPPPPQQLPACASEQIADDQGRILSPCAYFYRLVNGRPATQWMAILNEIEPAWWAKGFGQQRRSNGEVAARFFLPTASCPDASPPLDDARAKFLGVRQDERCWDQLGRIADPVTADGTQWIWNERGARPYQPFVGGGVVVDPIDPPPPGDSEALKARIKELDAQVAALTVEVANLTSSNELLKLGLVQAVSERDAAHRELDSVKPELEQRKADPCAFVSVSVHPGLFNSFLGTRCKPR